MSSNDLLYHILHFFFAGKCLIPRMNLSCLFEKNMFRAINHDLGNFRIIQKFLQSIQFSE